jgi:hypothetical protein
MQQIIHNNYLACFIFAFFLLLGCNYKNNSDLSSIKKHIDESYEKINETYNKLCGRPRNDFLKLEFEKLRTDIAYVRNISETLNNLDYEKQKEISDYSEKILESYHALLKLAESEIECW